MKTKRHGLMDYLIVHGNGKKTGPIIIIIRKLLQLSKRKAFKPMKKLSVIKNCYETHNIIISN